jgi:hypothetical protein
VFTAFFDANVLVPIALADILLSPDFVTAFREACA